MIAATLLGGLGLLVGELLQRMSEGSMRGRSSAFLATMQGHKTLIEKDLPAWLGRMRAAHPSLSSCLPSNPTATFTYMCGTIGQDASSAPASVVNMAAGRALRAFPLLDSSGQAIAGDNTPIFYDQTGARCISGTSCQDFSSRSYLVFNGGVGPTVPQNVGFIIAVEQAGKVTGTPFKPLVFEVGVGGKWSDLVGSCLDTERMEGINPDRTPICRPIVADPGKCSPGSIVVGIDSNNSKICEPINNFSGSLTTINSQVSGLNTANTSLRGEFDALRAEFNALKERFDTLKARSAGAIVSGCSYRCQSNKGAGYPCHLLHSWGGAKCTNFIGGGGQPFENHTVCPPHTTRGYLIAGANTKPELKDWFEGFNTIPCHLNVHDF